MTKNREKEFDKDLKQKGKIKWSKINPKIGYGYYGVYITKDLKKPKKTGKK